MCFMCRYSHSWSLALVLCGHCIRVEARNPKPAMQYFLEAMKEDPSMEGDMQLISVCHSHAHAHAHAQCHCDLHMQSCKSSCSGMYPPVLAWWGITFHAVIFENAGNEESMVAFLVPKTFERVDCCLHIIYVSVRLHALASDAISLWLALPCRAYLDSML